MSGPVLVELFAGAGGIGLGFARAGVRTVAWSEVEPHACAVMRHHHPDAVELGDVKGVTGERIRTLAGSDDIVLAGGFPCQDVSIAGRRAGLAGERSGLFFEFARIVGELSPRWVVVENVPGLLTSNGGADFAAVLRTLAGLGLALAWRIVDAQHFGVPQRRRRIFVVGHSAACDCGPRAVLDLPEGGCGNPAQGITPRTLTATRAGTGADGDRRVVATLQTRTGGRLDTDGAAGGHLVVNALTANGLGGGGPDDNRAQAGHLVIAVGGSVSHALTAEGADAGEDGSGRGTPIVYQGHGGNVGPLGTLRSGCNEGSGVPFTVVPLAVRGRAGGAQIESGEDGDPYNSLRAGDGGSSRQSLIQVASRVRRLVPVETERLMGWPDEHTAHGTRPDGTAYDLSDSARYRLCGNGVVAPVAQWIGARLLACQGMPANAPCEGVSVMTICRCPVPGGGRSVCVCAATECHDRGVHVFSSTTAFDAHVRRGGHVDPASVGLVLGEVAGSPCWRWPGDDDALSRKRRVNLSPDQPAGVPTPTPDRSERSEGLS